MSSTNDSFAGAFAPNRITLPVDQLMSTTKYTENASTDTVQKGEAHEYEPVFDDFLKHSSAQRESTDFILKDAIQAAHPGSAIVVTRDWNMHMSPEKSSDTFTITPVAGTEVNSHLQYLPALHRGDPGTMLPDIQYGVFKVTWEGMPFILYSTCFVEHGNMNVYQDFFVHEDEGAIHALLLAYAELAYRLNDEIYVWVQGGWRKDHELWKDVQKASWDDVILDAGFKKRLQDDISGFFASEKIYKKLAIPWKRGVIFKGPPGNGKTVSLKAILKETPHPILYVRNLASFMGEEWSIQQIFGMARRRAPCLVIWEDLDSLINAKNRSFFLNELDGLNGNDGLLLIGTTNHFDRLDPALSNRPSRFDRKFEFSPPNHDERVLYIKYWQKKLKNNKKIDFPDSLVETVAGLTSKFSFAYLKEAIVSSLTTLVGYPDRSFEDIVKEQIAALRKSIEKGHGEASIVHRAREDVASPFGGGGKPQTVVNSYGAGRYPSPALRIREPGQEQLSYGGGLNAQLQQNQYRMF